MVWVPAEVSEHPAPRRLARLRPVLPAQDWMKRGIMPCTVLWLSTGVIGREMVLIDAAMYIPEQLGVCDDEFVCLKDFSITGRQITGGNFIKFAHGGALVQGSAQPFFFIGRVFGYAPVLTSDGADGELKYRSYSHT